MPTQQELQLLTITNPEARQEDNMQPFSHSQLNEVSHLHHHPWFTAALTHRSSVLYITCSKAPHVQAKFVLSLPFARMGMLIEPQFAYSPVPSHSPPSGLPQIHHSPPVPFRFSSSHPVTLNRVGGLDLNNSPLPRPLEESTAAILDLQSLGAVAGQGQAHPSRAEDELRMNHRHRSSMSFHDQPHPFVAAGSSQSFPALLHGQGSPPQPLHLQRSPSSNRGQPRPAIDRVPPSPTSLHGQHSPVIITEQGPTPKEENIPTPTLTRSLFGPHLDAINQSPSVQNPMDPLPVAHGGTFSIIVEFSKDKLQGRVPSAIRMDTTSIDDITCKVFTYCLKKEKALYRK